VDLLLPPNTKAASRGSLLSEEGKRYERAPFASHPNSPSKTIASITERMGHYDEPKPTRKSKKLKKGESAQAVHSTNMAGAPKSRFTGAGLGMRNDESPAFNPQGSAKSVLKRILKEQQEQFSN
jgi:hypothetical protein